jgi:hypothetical protein
MFTAGIPLVGKESPPSAVTVVQPITALFKVHQAVNLARADERIARVKAGMSVSKSPSAVEKSYFELLFAQRREVLAEAHMKKLEKTNDRQREPDGIRSAEKSSRNNGGKTKNSWKLPPN